MATVNRFLSPSRKMHPSCVLTTNRSRCTLCVITASEDEDLVRASLDGDLNAFDEVVRRHQSMITRCLYRFCPYQADLEDLVQETFVKAFRKLNSWQATAPFENWLRKIAYNTGYDYFRKNSQQPRFDIGQSL